MEIQLTVRLRGTTKAQWEALLRKTGLEPDAQWDQTALLWDGDTLAATGSRMGNILKCIAVSPDHRGEDLTAQVLSTDYTAEGIVVETIVDPILYGRLKEYITKEC